MYFPNTVKNKYIYLMPRQESENHRIYENGVHYVNTENLSDFKQIHFTTIIENVDTYLPAISHKYKLEQKALMAHRLPNFFKKYFEICCFAKLLDCAPTENCVSIAMYHVEKCVRKVLISCDLNMIQ